MPSPSATWWSRWVGLAAGFMLIAASGGVYGFGSLASKIKTELNLTAEALGTVSEMGNVGEL